MEFLGQDYGDQNAQPLMLPALCFQVALQGMAWAVALGLAWGQGVVQREATVAQQLGATDHTDVNQLKKCTTNLACPGG
jgi:hypothetical protein